MDKWEMYGAIAGIVLSHVFVFSLGIWEGRRKEREETTIRQMQLDATKMWTDSLGGYMGGRR